MGIKLSNGGEGEMAEGIRIEDGEITGIEDSNSNNRKGKLRDTIRDSCTVTFLTV